MSINDDVLETCSFLDFDTKKQGKKKFIGDEFLISQDLIFFLMQISTN